MTSLRSPSGLTVRRLDPDSDAEVDLVASRMRATLVEVLDEKRANSMFTTEELRTRVRWHVADVPDRLAAVFLVEDELAQIVGHTIVRVDEVEEVVVGLFATTYVDPRARRRGVATLLLDHGEQWMRDTGMTTAVTYTDPHNSGLISLYVDHGYEVAQMSSEWTRATKIL